MNDRKPRIRVYTDGGCDPNPGSGGWGAVLLAHGEEPRELSGRADDTTNNRMEITAAISALEALDRPHAVELFTDSQYLRQGITEWIDGWRRRGWQTSQKTDVKNRDLWERLDATLADHEVEWHWVRGHAGNEWNERADALASAAIQHPSLPVDDPDAVHVFTGVSFSQKSGTGGWGILLRFRDHEKLRYGRVDETTGNRMHLVAAIEGLRSLTRRMRVHIYTKSDYACEGAQRWIPGWRQRDWRTREGDEVQHRDLWEQLDAAQREHDVEWHVVKQDLPDEMTRAKEAARG